MIRHVGGATVTTTSRYKINHAGQLTESVGQLTCAKPEDIPAMVTDLNDSGSFNRRLTLPQTPKQIALMTATPANGEVMPR